jgi:hypothetical protein
MPITSAPGRLANWTVIEPTPPAAPETATVSPLLQGYGTHGRIRRASGNGERPGNFPRYVHWLTREVLRVDNDILGVAGAPVGETDDLVPDVTASTPLPTWVTIPAKSLPSPDGKLAGQTL